MKRLLALMALIVFISSLLASFVEGNILFKSNTQISVTGYDLGVVVTDRTWFNDIAVEYHISTLDTLYAIPSGDFEGFYYIAEFDSSLDIEDLINDLEKESSIEYAEPNYEMELLGINTNDTYASTSWGLEKIGMNQVWASQIAYGDYIKVAVLDTGIDLGIAPFGIHPDLESNLWDDGNGVHGHNVLGEVNQPGEDEEFPHDNVGHGTHVAGIIGATTNNSTGVAGVAGGWGSFSPGCTVMPVRICELIPTTGTAVRGIRWAVSHGAEVINMSWGMDEDINQTLRNWIQFIMVSYPSVVFVAGAGNDGVSTSFFPASIPGVISVGATGPNDARAPYSNFGSVDICAPGGIGQVGETTGIISTTPQDDGFIYHNPQFVTNTWDCSYEYATGTSMAAPMVTGAVALLKDNFPGITREQIIQRLQGTADDLTQMNTNPIYMTSLGTGRVNIYRALTEEPHPTYRLNAIEVEDEDGILTTGEDDVDIKITLKNWWVDGSEEVDGILATDDPFITIDTDTGSWDSLDYLETGLSSRFIISDSSNYSRNIRFVLHLYYEDIEETVFFELPCYPNLITLFESEDYIVTSEIAVFDMDNDGIDELAFGVKKPILEDYLFYACLFRNNQLVTRAVDDSIEAKPVFSDLIYGGDKEVVFVTNLVTVYACDSQLNSIANFPYISQESFPGRIKSFVVDDLTGNGQMDIVASGNIHLTGNGFFYYVFQYDYPRTDFYDLFYQLNNSVTILSEIAVGNVDHNANREILAVVKNNTNWVGIVKNSTLFVAKGSYSIVSNISWVLDPGLDFISKLRSTNLLLLKPQFTDPEEPVYHNRLFFGIAKKFEPGIPRATNYATYCFDFSESNTEADLIWYHVDGSRIPFNQTEATDIDPGKIISGEFYVDNFGLELLTTASEEVIDPESGSMVKHLTNDYCPINGGYYHRNRRPSLLADIEANNSQDVIVSNSNQISAYKTHENPIQSFAMNFFAEVKSLAIGSAINNAVRDVYVLVGDTDTNGVGLYRIPVKSNLVDEVDEWTQFQNNERSTAQYLSHVPSLIVDDTTIWQDIVINRDTDVISGVCVSVNPGVEVRIRNKIIIQNFGSIDFNGEELHPVSVAGMCPLKVKDHWLGVSSGNNSSLVLNDTFLSNAEIGLEMYENGCFHITNSRLHYNEISASVYNSLVDFGHDRILDSTIGIASYHGAVPYLAWNSTGENQVSGNECGIFAVQSLPYLDEGLNNIFDNEPFNIKTDDARGIEARVNWWGSSSEQFIQDHFSDYEDVIYEGWCSAPNGNAGKNGSCESLILAETARMSNDWSMAIQYYYQILNDSLTTSEDNQALKGNTVCHSRINQLPSFIGWLDDKIIAYQYDDAFSKELLNTKALCSRLVGSYQDALNHYSDILDSSPAIIDSCFALIDMGFTWLESGGNLRTKYAALMPSTSQDQIINARRMLETLRNPNTSQEHVVPLKPVLYNNYPNPFNPSTTIEYSIPQTGQVKLSIFNIRGQKVKTLIDGDSEKGQHRVVWDGRDDSNRSVASGVYFIRLEAAGKTRIRKAMLLK